MQPNLIFFWKNCILLSLKFFESWELFPKYPFFVVKFPRKFQGYWSIVVKLKQGWRWVWISGWASSLASSNVARCPAAPSILSKWGEEGVGLPAPPLPPSLIETNRLSPYLSKLAFSNSPVWNFQFDELDFFPSLKWIFVGYTGSKNPVQTGKKYQFIKLEISNWKIWKIQFR